MVDNSVYPCITSSNTTDRFIQYNYLWSGNNNFYEANGTPYTNITDLDFILNFNDNFSGLKPVFDSNWRLTSASVNNSLKSGGIMIPGLVSDISGSPRPGSDGDYAVGPYEY